MAQSETAAKPDILFIMPDQMRGDCLSIVGHPAVHTPNLDQLARQGVLFRRAYSTVPSCVPARYALLTGHYPQTSGVVGFQGKKFVTPVLPEALAAAGYATALVGRNMHQLDENGSCGYQRQILGSTYVKGDDYDEFLKKAVPGSGGIRGVVDAQGLTNNWWQATHWPLDEDLHPTSWIVGQSRKIVEGTCADQPLFLTTSFYSPHPPLFPPKLFFDAYLQQELPEPAHGNWVDWQALTPQGDKHGRHVLLQGETLRKAQAGYFGLIEHIDEQIALLIADFKARSEKAGRPWVVVVTSDHGEMLGDHGYFRKCEPYEGSSNIPFIFAGSPNLGFAGGCTIHRPVCLEDILPTLLTLAGAPVHPSVDGVNLLPVLRGSNETIREYLHFEHATCYAAAQQFHALTDGRHKYIWRPADGTEHLFDLTEDPQEERDLALEEAHVQDLEQWRSRLIQRLARRPEGFVKDSRLVTGCPYPAHNEGTLGISG